MISEDIKRLQGNLDKLPAGLMDQLRFVRHTTEFKGKIEIDDYLILEEYPEIDYVLLRREAKYEPFVAAWGYNKDGNYWNQGHYFSELIDAVNYIQYKLDEKNGVERIELDKRLKKKYHDIAIRDRLDYIIYESDDVEEYEDEIHVTTDLLKVLGYEKEAEEYEESFEDGKVDKDE